jgi:L-ribulose-5-phosphate 3-epimerase
MTSRRDFLTGAGAAALASLIARVRSVHGASMFKLSIFTDEISHDFEHALAVASKDMGLSWVEVRAMWNKNITTLDAKEIADATKLLDKYKLRVSSIAGPLFKVDWPGAPVSKLAQRDQFGANYTFEQQDDILDRGLELTKAFKTDRLRCFDFWRIEDPAPYRKAMDEKLRQAAERAGKRGVTLVMENEYACNTATAAEAVRTLEAVPSTWFKLNWDPGNSAFRNETPYPDGYNLLPKDRIGHVHCKDVSKKPDGGVQWECIGRGFIDFAGHFRALAQDGYTGAIVLETHWRGAGTPEASSRQSMAGLKDALKKAGVL